MPHGTTVKGCSMSINTDAAALSMHESLDSLKVTPQEMHRIYFEINDAVQWYAIMREARQMFGREWRCKKHMKRKLRYGETVRVWFDVPDANFGTWISVKYAVPQKIGPNK